MTYIGDLSSEAVESIISTKMSTREQDHAIGDSPEFDQERELNQQRYEELEGLMEGKSWVVIETETHCIDLKPEVFCQRPEGCLEIDITPVTRDDEGNLTFYYHLNRTIGIADWGIEGLISAEKYGIPVGGSLVILKSNQGYGDDPSAFADFGKLVQFVKDQALIGKKDFPEPNLPESNL